MSDHALYLEIAEKILKDLRATGKIPLEILHDLRSNYKMFGLGTHVDNWIDDPFPIHDEAVNYAKWFLNYKRMPAASQMKFYEFMKDHKLFCMYEGEQYRVTGASRMGDVYLTKDFGRDAGYDKRVSVDKCSQWSPEPIVDKQDNTEHWSILNKVQFDRKDCHAIVSSDFKHGVKLIIDGDFANEEKRQKYTQSLLDKLNKFWQPFYFLS